MRRSLRHLHTAKYLKANKHSAVGGSFSTKSHFELLSSSTLPQTLGSLCSLLSQCFLPLVYPYRAALQRTNSEGVRCQTQTEWNHTSDWISWGFLNSAHSDLFPHDQLILCQAVKDSPSGFRFGDVSAATQFTGAALRFPSEREAAEASDTGCRIWSLPEHFMLQSVTANWRVGVLGLWWGRKNTQRARMHAHIHQHTHAHTLPYASMCSHMHTFGCVRWPLNSLLVLGPVPGSVLGSPQNKERLCFPPEAPARDRATVRPLLCRQSQLFHLLMKKSRHGGWAESLPGPCIAVARTGGGPI